MIKRIQQLCAANINHIKAMANLVIKDHYDKDYGEDILRKRGVCGPSQEAIAVILLSEGIQIEKYICRHKFSQPIYPFDHTFSVIEGIIIDAGYYQCVNHFGLTQRDMPKEEILIFPYAALEEVVDVFMRLSRHTSSAKSSDIKNLTDEELRKRFLEVWDYRNNRLYIKEKQSFHQVILDYARSNIGWCPKDN